MHNIQKSSKLISGFIDSYIIFSNNECSFVKTKNGPFKYTNNIVPIHTEVALNNLYIDIFIPIKNMLKNKSINSVPHSIKSNTLKNIVQ